MEEEADDNRSTGLVLRGGGDEEEEEEEEDSSPEGESEDETINRQPAQQTTVKRKRKKSKKKLERERTLPIIVQWLQETYEEKEGKTVGRYQVYDDYLEFCSKSGHLPTNNAALGKIFKRVFPNVGWRRLGKRGESKMHYANIRKRKVKLEPSATRAGSAHETIKAEPEELPDDPHESIDRVVAIKDDDNGNMNNDDDDDDSDEQSVFMDYRLSQHGPGEAVEGGDAFFPLTIDNPMGDDRFAGFGDESSINMLGGVVPMAQHRPKFPGRERERRWRRRDHLTTVREEMEEPRGLFLGLGSSPASTPSSSQGNVMIITPPTNPSIWNANAHLDLMMAVRYYRDRFRKISWSLIPINPMSLKMRLLNYLFSTEDGQLERSSLSLSACVMISIASFGAGHFDVAEEFFHKAREHLSYVFDSSDYDVASALVPLAWLTTFFSPTAEEGRNRQIYFCTIGTKICEQVGALNDETNWALLSTLHVKSMENVSDAIAKTRAYPPYQKNWKKTRLQRGRISGTYDQTGEIFGTIFSLSIPLLRGHALLPEEDLRIKHGLMVQLGRIREAEQSLVHAQDQQVRDMMAAYYYAMRTFINVLLENSRQIETARELVKTLLLADRPIMAVVIHELASNNFLLIRTAAQVLARYREYKGLKILMEAIYPFTSRFPWMHTTYDLMQRAVQESLVALRQSPGGERALLNSSPPLPLVGHRSLSSSPRHPSSSFSFSSSSSSFSFSLSSSSLSYPQPSGSSFSGHSVPPPPSFYLSASSEPSPHDAAAFYSNSAPSTSSLYTVAQPQPQQPYYQPRHHQLQQQVAYGQQHPHHQAAPELPMGPLVGMRSSPASAPSPLPDRRPSSASYSYIFYADPSSSSSTSSLSSSSSALSSSLPAADQSQHHPTAYLSSSTSSSSSTSPTVPPSTAPFHAGSAAYPTISPELSPSLLSRSTTFRPIAPEPHQHHQHPGFGSPSLSRALDDMSLLESFLSSPPSPPSSTSPFSSLSAAPHSNEQPPQPQPQQGQHPQGHHGDQTPPAQD